MSEICVYIYIYLFIHICEYVRHALYTYTVLGLELAGNAGIYDLGLIITSKSNSYTMRPEPTASNCSVIFIL